MISFFVASPGRGTRSLSTAGVPSLHSSATTDYFGPKRSIIVNWIGRRPNRADSMWPRAPTGPFFYGLVSSVLVC